MSETVLYRKYRPQKFKDVVGQDHIVDVLQEAIKLGNISHAYLFSGSRGTGKTSIARIFAREIGTSENDLYEIDAASNRGIDDVREIRDGVNVLPFESKYKVYIVDEVHMLTKDAFNALLKTLEEPPAHAIFILATTELDKVLDTVISRCQAFVFKKPTQKILKDLVAKVAKKEGFELDSASADLIALLGDGSFRDAFGILQKVIGSSSDKKIGIDEVELVTGAPKKSIVNNFVQAIDARDAARGLSAVRAASGANIDMGVFLKLALHKLRAVMLLRYSPDMRDALAEEFSAEDFALLGELAKGAAAPAAGAAANTVSGISSKAILALLRAGDQLRFSPISELPLELALIELSDAQSLPKA